MKLLGCDVSYGRLSETAAVGWEYDPVTEQASIFNVWVEEIPSQPEVINFIEAIEAEESFDAIAVDAIAFGRGVVDHLNLTPYAHKVWPFVASARASLEWEPEDTQSLMERSYMNLKTRVIMEMRKQAYRGKVRVPNHPRLVSEMGLYKLTQINNRWKVEDPKQSPDVGDAAIIGYFLTLGAVGSFWMGTSSGSVARPSRRLA